MTRVTVTFPGNGNVTAELHLDLSLLLGTNEAYAELIRADAATQSAGIAKVASALQRGLHFTVGDQPIPLTLAQWELPDVPPEKIGDLTVATMTTLVLVGAIPSSGGSFQLLSEPTATLEFPLALTLTASSEHVSITRWLELPGTSSRPYPVPASAWTTPVPTRNPELSPAPKAFTSSTPAVAATPGSPTLADRFETARQYLWLGFLHIIPRGTDHILFVLGLFFLGLSWRPLVWQTTVFTIAHTTTLGLSAYGIFSLPARVVEPLIAASIAYVAIENIVRPKLTAVRLAIVFSFGLLHGLGFASSLSEIQLPRNQFFAALLAFNFGVDFGQLAIIALAFASVGWWRKRDWYFPRIVVPACSLIAAIGCVWAVQRVIT
ncbi:MAG: HupE/UreJ family protein [Opitutus sp.]